MQPLPLDDIQARAEAATREPWLVGGPYPGVSVCIETAPAIVCTDCPEPAVWEPICILDSRQEGEPDPQSLANATFLAHARSDIPALVEECRMLRAALGEVCGWLVGFDTYFGPSGTGMGYITLEQREALRQILARSVEEPRP